MKLQFLFSLKLTIAPLLALNSSTSKKKIYRKHKVKVSSKEDQIVHPFQDALDSTNKRTASQDALPVKKRKTSSTTNKLELQTRDEFELVASQDPTPPKNPSSDFSQEVPNRITKTTSLSNYIEKDYTPSSTNPTPSTSSRANVTTNIRPNDHDICEDSSDNSDTNSVLERELYPGESKAGATYKRHPADYTSAISNKFLINEITKSKAIKT